VAKIASGPTGYATSLASSTRRSYGYPAIAHDES
jgi:hypothetical protein